MYSKSLMSELINKERLLEFVTAQPVFPAGSAGNSIFQTALNQTPNSCAKATKDK